MELCNPFVECSELKIRPGIIPTSLFVCSAKQEHVRVNRWSHAHEQPDPAAGDRDPRSFFHWFTKSVS